MAFAIIAAGGRGTRLGGPTPKFEVQLAGRPVLMHSLEVFESAPSIEAIVLVVPEDRVDDWDAGSLKRRGVAKLLATVPGGETRQESVRRGLERLAGETGVVVVHDAARPLVTVETIEAACKVPDHVDGVITAIAVTDTIKCVDGVTVTGTPDRERLVAVQTPQAFRIEVLAGAHASALVAGFTGTDDAALVERAGGLVGVIEGSRENIKVTFQEDVAIAEAILLERRKG